MPTAEPQAGPDVSAILKLRVPVIVRLAQRGMSLSDVLNLSPGSMIELTKTANEPLDLLVNNKEIGVGQAVKIGERFGLRMTAIGDAGERLQALSPSIAGARDSVTD